MHPQVRVMERTARTRLLCSLQEETLFGTEEMAARQGRVEIAQSQGSNGQSTHSCDTLGHSHSAMS